MLRALFIASMSVLVLGVACGSPLHAAGTGCAVDGDCAAGLSCLAFSTGSDAGCIAVAQACTKSCRVDADCIAVGPQFKCFASCGATSGTCGQTQ